MSGLSAFQKSKNLKGGPKITEKAAPSMAALSPISKHVIANSTTPTIKYSADQLSSFFQALVDFDATYAKIETHLSFEFMLGSRLVYHYRQQQRHTDYFIALCRVVRQFRHCIRSFTLVRAIQADIRDQSKNKSHPSNAELSSYLDDSSCQREIYCISSQIGAVLGNIPRALPRFIKQIAMTFFLPQCYIFLAHTTKMYRCLRVLLPSYIVLWRTCHALQGYANVPGMSVDGIEIEVRTSEGNVFDSKAQILLSNTEWHAPMKSNTLGDPERMVVRSAVSALLDKKKFKNRYDVQVPVAIEGSSSVVVAVASNTPALSEPKVLVAEASTDEETECEKKDKLAATAITTKSQVKSSIKSIITTKPTVMTTTSTTVTAKPTTVAPKSTATHSEIKPTATKKLPIDDIFSPLVSSEKPATKKRPSSDSSTTTQKAKKKKASSSLDDIFGW